MEDAFAGSCVQSLFEPKADLSLCVNKSIKLFLKEVPIPPADSVDRADEQNSTDAKKEQRESALSENLSLLNGYAYFNRIKSNINLLHTELHGIKRDFLFQKKQTKKNIQKLKIVRKQNKIYQSVLQEIKKDRRRKETYELLCTEIQKLEEVNYLNKKQQMEKRDIEDLQQKMKDIENAIRINDENIQRTIQQISDIVSTNLQP
ncbi:conserved Plasmodium protein, unknown function [Plasmodium knowlesi strain H]|uniref:Uncharacterized protein n=3 Tax=Plasmodium knowlesi TaxID=5850 RepID=A0A5K1U4R7_PLAKH|nr:conserved Plasmodium protein, unknown function [Plasmodium knowlesi strain H]OTN64517.1 Uncharacterized protein PKNOH_S130200200 [Plasmodium knowlesi]CAA9989162.1 conserved Plasmodium protein, unknown function [Plasmodium knowlesi strain H]SBO27381.1 conserved Plasmodium protein, unknown function [Plasmodium knowlesi strain H]SBO27507.1 conserved Plasmodium protein, unknown function [Plasmodium knowlesi strain H]VVS78636.1 conserved Plasmodium protein, unknown function [Plasmodium knowlesi |eukprot:XP_002261509.1 hypothetical protein, conserved in Plasmodium species [Plasmodium knowlesi strain H]